MGENAGGGMWEIEETGGGESPEHGGGNDVYVAVGKGSSSMAAFRWAMKHVAKPRDFVYLVHVYPEVKNIPTPLGMLPREQVRPDQIQTYLNVEKAKRIKMLQPFFKLGNSHKVVMDTVMIESDAVGNAIIELIPVLLIKTLIMGVSKSNIRAVKRGSSKAGHVLKNAPEYCEVTVISEGGLRVSLEGDGSSPLPQLENVVSHHEQDNDEDVANDMASCVCFSTKFIR